MYDVNHHLMHARPQWGRSVINLGGPGHLSSSFNPPFFPSLSWTPHAVWAEPAHPLPNILIQFIQSNSVMKSTLMFSLMYYRNQRACRVQPLSAELILWITDHVQQHGSKKWRPVNIGTPLPENEGARTP